ncbi:MAG: type II toxin-antitoxin system HicA family toxin [Zoogloeaceae bacterium]|nr:type II toxin-antitoxin system HicA family toxin [Rhodocyclaceae bacterium]MCP5236658.1 type II toxin-antitoxin system HicA family toxin [Zoogloeaceae bacterium]
MSSKHRNLLRQIYQDPAPGNIQWREVESLLSHLGADIEPGHGARFHVRLNRREFVLHHPHHGNTFGRQDVRHLRDFLASAGVTPSRYEHTGEATEDA